MNRIGQIGGAKAEIRGKVQTWRLLSTKWESAKAVSEENVQNKLTLLLFLIKSSSMSVKSLGSISSKGSTLSGFSPDNAVITTLPKRSV